MSRLIRMDSTGHSTLAEWTAQDDAAFDAAVERFRRGPAEERVAQGLLGDLLGHESRELQRETGLAMERGELGTWLVGEAGALLLAPDGKRVHCFCVTVTDSDLPPSDRIAHLLL